MHSRMAFFGEWDGARYVELAHWDRAETTRVCVALRFDVR